MMLILDQQTAIHASDLQRWCCSNSNLTQYSSQCWTTGGTLYETVAKPPALLAIEAQRLKWPLSTGL